MKKNSILLISAALLMLAGCTVDELAGSKDGQIPVRLSVSQEATVTRAADGLYTNTTGFDGGEQVEVYVNNSDTHGTYQVNSTSKTALDATNAANTLYYPTSGDANLYAVYPNTSTESHTVKYDQTTEENYKASDLMYAKTTVAQADKENTQNLQFNHQLVKLKVVIVKAADVSQVTQVMMNNVKRQVSVTLGPSSMTLGTPATATGGEATGGDNILVFSGSNTQTEAQTYAVVFPVQSWSNQDFITVTADGKTATYKLTKDNFAAGSEYTLTLNINAAALNNTVSITNWTGNQGSCEVRPTVTETRYVATPVGAIPGLFTINADGDQVFFSKGNLQYKRSTNTWSFMEHQYSTVETANQNVGTDYASQDVVSLFGWGTSGKTISNYGTANQPYATSTTNTAYGPTDGTSGLTGDYANGDWGVNIGTGWRTLSKDEWVYLFNTRTTATTGLPAGENSGAARYTKATVAGVSGVILFPDNYAHPAGVTVTVSNAAYNTGNKDYTTFTVDASNWVTMESAGCVFLPAAGDREGTSVTVFSVGSRGYYWSSTAGGTDYALYVYFGSGYLGLAGNDDRSGGRSVRLVRPVQP